ncbi:GntR family transcriptional regulator [Aquabacterium sp.]|uniref:GntR family transcriptional regulator n=1 Tax=Aquabacterium sp. TaxID=1872578 RepID=UPI002CD08B6F|nr:GntR family transcriptional regulator [Aquabacterium sp.]HSW04439.1 GntR family transcriptional regulator [Aquabacterium sp.]
MQHQKPISRRKPEPTLSPLQRQVAGRIVDWVRSSGMAPGEALSELSAAAALGVSRTPVRAALIWLDHHGLLERRRGTGYVTTRPAADFSAPELSVASDDAEHLFVAIARARNAGQLPTDISESDLMRRFEVTRPTLLRVLTRLAEVGMVERKAGHGWAFRPAHSDTAAEQESYRFRLLIEPAGLREPGFALAPGWSAQMRARHKAMLGQRWHDGAAVELFEMNAAFHEGLAAASGNRFVLMAMQQQNRMRRFINYEWGLGRERMVVSCSEHLEILDRLDAGDREVAAVLLQRHLDKAGQLRKEPGG